MNGNFSQCIDLELRTPGFLRPVLAGACALALGSVWLCGLHIVTQLALSLLIPLAAMHSLRTWLAQQPAELRIFKDSCTVRERNGNCVIAYWQGRQFVHSSLILLSLYSDSLGKRKRNCYRLILAPRDHNPDSLRRLRVYLRNNPNSGNPS
ncbi:MAG: hypothetical protein ACYYK0_06610 [Candidatus Eutrophobiaceae bacterium]